MLRLIILTIVAVLLAACGANVSPAAPTKPCWDGSMARPCPPKPKPPEPTPEPEPEPTPPIVVVPEPPVVEPEPEPTPPIVVPPPTGPTLKAVQACTSAPYPIGNTSDATDGTAFPVYGQLVVGQVYPYLATGLGHQVTPTRYKAVTLPSGVSTYFLETCFG